jgi:general bacterial porin, GBP family
MFGWSYRRDHLEEGGVMGDKKLVAGRRVSSCLANKLGGTPNDLIAGEIRDRTAPGRNPRTLALLIGLGLFFATWTGAARADIGLSPDGIFNGYGYKTDEVNLTFYGIIDIGYGTLEHSFSASSDFASTINPYNLNGSPNRFTGFYNGGISMNRVGVQGDKNFGDGFYGVDVFFKLEEAINPIYGTISNNGKSIFNNINGLTTANGASAIDGQWFSRAAYVGISHPVYGSLEFGRTTNFSLDQVVEYDPVQAALLYSPLGFSGGIGGGLGATENTRLDNSFKYQNSITDLNLGGTTVPGRIDFGVQYRFATSTDDQEAESGYVAMLGYKYGPFSLKATYSQTFNTVAYATEYSNVVAPDPNLQIENTSGFMVSGKYEINSDATVKIGYENTTVTAPSNLNLTGIVSYYGLTLPEPAVNASGTQTFGTFWVGGDYKIVKNLDLGFGYYNVDTYNTPEKGKQYRSNIFSGLADYTIMKGLDTYAGAMLLKFDGPALTHHAPVDAFSYNAIYGAGVRVKF